MNEGSGSSLKFKSAESYDRHFMEAMWIVTEFNQWFDNYFWLPDVSVAAENDGCGASWDFDLEAFDCRFMQAVGTPESN
jgi:hypothetical protein